MSRQLTWLLAGAAFTFCAGAGVALAADQAADQRSERRVERDVRVHRFAHADGPRAMRHHGRDRTQHLKDILQLRPEQEPALKAYVEATKRHEPGDRMVRFDWGDDSKPTPERLAEMERHMAEQQAAMRARIEATRTFYAQLDERQKKAFDAMPLMMMAGPHLGPMVFAHRLPIPPTPPAPPTPPR